MLYYCSMILYIKCCITVLWYYTALQCLRYALEFVVQHEQKFIPVSALPNLGTLLKMK